MFVCGYSIILFNKVVINSVNKVNVGDEIKFWVIDGEIISIVIYI